MIILLGICYLLISIVVTFSWAKKKDTPTCECAFMGIYWPITMFFSFFIMIAALGKK